MLRRMHDCQPQTRQIGVLGLLGLSDVHERYLRSQHPQLRLGQQWVCLYLRFGFKSKTGGVFHLVFALKSPTVSSRKSRSPPGVHERSLVQVTELRDMRLGLPEAAKRGSLLPGTPVRTTSRTDPKSQLNGKDPIRSFGSQAIPKGSQERFTKRSRGSKAWIQLGCICLTDSAGGSPAWPRWTPPGGQRSRREEASPGFLERATPPGLLGE